MDREEILKKSREEHHDEMEEQVRDRSMKWTYIALVASAAVFAFVRGMNGQPIMDLCATVCISVCAGRIYRFVRIRDRFDLIMALLTLALSVFAAIRFFMGH